MNTYKDIHDLDEFAGLKQLAKAKGEITAVSFDFGNNCGYAITWHKTGAPFVLGQEPMIFGQIDLSIGPYESGAIRFVRLRKLLNNLNPDLVAFEDVRYTPAGHFPSAYAAVARAAGPQELFGALKYAAATWCEEAEPAVVSQPIGIGTIKKRATGRGNANKLDVIKATNKVLGPILDEENWELGGLDNVADAFWCLVCALEQLDEGLVPRQ